MNAGAATALGIVAALSVAPSVRQTLSQAPPLVRSQLAWFDRTGKRLATLGDLGDYGNIELSPDAAHVAVAVLDPALGTRDLWSYGVSDGSRIRITAESADENWLIWSNDGRRVAFNAFSADHLGLYQMTVDGAQRTAAREALLTADEGVWPVSWSPDGRNILFVRNAESTGNDIWVLPLAGDRKPYPFLQTRAAENWAAFSPNGKWIAYSSTESGDAEVYVTTFPASARKWLVSTGGGFQARWRRDGTELYYLAPDRRLMVAAVNSTATGFEVRGVSPLFDIRLPYAPYHAYDVTPDGQRFLVNTLVLGPGGATRAENGGGRRLEPTDTRSGEAGRERF